MVLRIFFHRFLCYFAFFLAGTLLPILQHLHIAAHRHQFIPYKLSTQETAILPLISDRLQKRKSRTKAISTFSMHLSKRYTLPFIVSIKSDQCSSLCRNVLLISTTFNCPARFIKKNPCSFVQTQLAAAQFQRAHLPKLSVSDRPVSLVEGGYIHQLQNAIDHGLSTASSFYSNWKDNMTRTVDLFTTLLEPKAAIVPSQKTLLTLPAEERKRLVFSFHRNEAAVLFIGWIEPLERNQTSEAVNLIGYAAVAEVTDVALLDATGEIGIQLIGRCKVTEVVKIDTDGCQVKVIPHRDTRNVFKNPSLTTMNIQALHSLYDRCNEAEALYRDLQGKSDVAKVVRLRQHLDKKVDEMLSKFDQLTEEEIAEWLSFCAMDYHIDPKARCWAVELQSTEARLALVRSALEEKLTKLKKDIRVMKETI